MRGLFECGKAWSLLPQFAPKKQMSSESVKYHQPLSQAPLVLPVPQVEKCGLRWKMIAACCDYSNLTTGLSVSVV